MGGGGGASFKPCDQVVRGGLVSKKIFCSSLWASVWSKNKGEGRGGGGLPLLSDSPDDVNWQ